MLYFISISTQETYEALSQFLFMWEYYMKEYKHNEELLEHLISKDVRIPNKNSTLKKIENILIIQFQNYFQKRR